MRSKSAPAPNAVEGNDQIRPAHGPVSRTSVRSEVRAKKISQLVADQLREEIGLGEIKSGDLLPPEPELIARFAVSRPTLREAIRILETEGLVTTSRGGRKGARVHHPSSAMAARSAGLVLRLRGATILDVFELASILVPAAARKVAELRPTADLTELEAIVAEVSLQTDHPRELARLLRRFDVALCDLSGNEALKFVSQVMAEIIDAQIEDIPERTEDLPKENADDIIPAQGRMREIITALAAQDGVRAERLLRTRLEEMVSHHRRVVDHSHRLKMIS